MAEDYIPAVVPIPGQIVSIVLQMSTLGVLCICITRRASWIKNWRTLSLAVWLILMIYVDSTLFILATSVIVHGLGINSSRVVCEGGILLCLVCYMTTKILIYYFLVERAYIIRGSLKPRLKTKLWLFDCLFMIVPYMIFVVMNFVWRITYINDKGVCIIGMQKVAMLPLIIFEVIVNIYLTLLFILPLRQLYSYKNNINPKLNRIAFRSFMGSLATLTTSVGNLTILTVLRGEPGWICLMCCNVDIIFCVIVLHWGTSHDKTAVYVLNYGIHNKTPDTLRRAHTHSFSELDSVEPEKTDTVHAEIIKMVLGDTHIIDSSFWFYNASPTSNKLPGTVTTEITSGQLASTHGKSQGRRVLRKNRDGSECEDEVGQHAIHVQQEISIDSEEGASETMFSGEHSMESSRTHSVEGALTMDVSVSAEHMV